MPNDNPWALQVGRFVLAFGDIEHTTVLLFSLIPKCSFPRTAARLPLGTRLEILYEALSGNDGEYQEVREAIARVQKMVKHRNLIAHNAIRFDFYKDGDKIVIDQNLVSSRDGKKKLSLAQLEMLADEAGSLSLGLTNASIPLMHRVSLDFN